MKSNFERSENGGLNLERGEKALKAYIHDSGLFLGRAVYNVIKVIP
jgi:hypothetical protein